MGYSQGQRIVGSIASRSASSQTVSGSVTYSAGYYPNNWTVTGLDTSDATAYAKNIEMGYSAYCRGTKIAGTATIPHEILKYNGTISDLICPKSKLNFGKNGGSRIGDYAYIAPDVYTYNISDLYDTSLVRKNGTGVNYVYGASWIGCTSNSEYLLAYCPRSASTSWPKGNSTLLNPSLTTTSTSFGTTGYMPGVGSNKNYFFLVGGYNTSSGNSDTYLNTVCILSNSLVESYGTSLKKAGYGSFSSSIGDYAIFSGINQSGYQGKETWAYNSSATVQYLQNAVNFDSWSGQCRACNNIYALFAVNGASELYDENLTKYTINTGATEAAGLGNNFINSAGQVINASQTTSNISNFSKDTIEPVAAWNPSYVLFAGGYKYVSGTRTNQSTVIACYET